MRLSRTPPPLALLCWAIGLLWTAGCARSASPEAQARAARELASETGLSVWIVGIDGGTFEVLDPLLREGSVPAFARFAREGARGRLESEAPMLSPALWTTVATGRPRSEHGVEGFLAPDSTPDAPRLVAASHRRVPALWSIASALGRDVGVLGWWASWPAEPVSGFIVSDRATRTRWAEWTGAIPDGVDSPGGNATHPPELITDLASSWVDPLAPPMAEFDSLCDWNPAERDEFLRAEHPIYAHGWSVLRFGFCSQRSIENATLAQLDSGAHPALLATFLVATDPTSHAFWHTYEPRHFAGVNWESAKRLRELIPNVYRHNDRFLAQLLERADSNTVILLVSDHGFRASGYLPRPRSSRASDLKDGAPPAIAIGQSGMHDESGMFLALGGPIRAGANCEATLYDVAPTALALLGLPVPDDWTGRVLTEIVEPDFWTRHPVRRVPSYDSWIAPPPELPESGRSIAGTDDALRQLEALGYVDGTGASERDD